jgi:hypothetical protein
MKKRGQASTQSVIIYAISFVIFVLIITLFWMGFLDPRKYLPASCIAPVGMVCVDSVAKSSHISMVLSNPKKEPIYIKDISIEKAENCQLVRIYSAKDGQDPFSQYLGPGESKEFILLGCNFEKDFTATDITIQYYSSNNLLYTDTGSYRHKIEKTYDVNPNSNDIEEVCKKAEILKFCEWLKQSHNIEFNNYCCPKYCSQLCPT